MSIRIRTVISATTQTPGVAIPKADGEGFWVVPPEFDAWFDELAYSVRLRVGVPPDSAAVAILQLEIHRRGLSSVHDDNSSQPIHSAGLRELSLPEMLEAAIQAAAKFMTPGFELNGMVISIAHGKQPKIPSSQVRAITKRTKRSNKPTQAAADRAYSIVKTLKANGYKDWVRRACGEIGVSRPTLFRLLAKTNYNKKSNTTKRGKK